MPQHPNGFGRFMAWAEALRDKHGLRILAIACETAGIFYWALWDFLGQQPGLARLLYNPRTTEHMGVVLSKRVRDDLVDALLLAEQLRLGSTPEVQLQEDVDLLAAHYYSRYARDLAQQVNHKKNQLRALLRAYTTLQQRKRFYLKCGNHLIQNRPETKLLKGSLGAGISNTLALVSEVGDVQRFPSADELASFLGLTTSKHLSGTTLFRSKWIAKQGSPNGRYAAVNIAQHPSRHVPRYQAMYQRIRGHKPPRKGNFIALVAIARDFVINVLYDLWRDQRPFFKETKDYRHYRQKNPHSDD